MILKRRIVLGNRRHAKNFLCAGQYTLKPVSPWLFTVLLYYMYVVELAYQIKVKCYLKLEKYNKILKHCKSKLSIFPDFKSNFDIHIISHITLHSQMIMYDL